MEHATAPESPANQNNSDELLNAKAFHFQQARPEMNLLTKYREIPKRIDHAYPNIDTSVTGVESAPDSPLGHLRKLTDSRKLSQNLYTRE